MGTCKLCEKLGELLEKQLIGEFVFPAWRGSVQAHNRYGQVPAGDMKLDSLERLKGQGLERCTVTESAPNNEGNEHTENQWCIAP